MPNISLPTGQDFTSVNIGSNTVRRTGVPKKAADVTRAKKMGLLTTEKKYGSGGNASVRSGGVMSVRKLEETDELKHKKVDKSLSKAIMQARTSKKMTQKDLATKINEKPQVIQEYESGKAIPNGALIVKMERALGCKLPRPGKKPAGAAGAAKKKPVGTGMVGGRAVGRGPAKRR